MSTVPAPSASSRRIAGNRQLLPVVGFCAFFCCAELGRSLSGHNSAYVSFWLPSGVSLSLLLLSEMSEWPLLLLAFLAANLLFDLSHGQKLSTVLMLFCANESQALAGVFLIRRFVARRPTLDSVREFAGFLFWGAGVSSAVGATLGTLALTVAGFSTSFAHSWTVWWCSTAMAILLVAPFIVAWWSARSGSQAGRLTSARILELTLMFTGVTTSTWYLLVVGQGFSAPYKSGLVLFVVWAGLRFGLRGASTVNLLLAILVAYLSSHFPNGESIQQLASGEYVRSLQAFLGVSAMVGLVPALILSERDQTLDLLRASRHRFQTLTEASFEGVCISINGRIIDANDQALEMFGYTRKEFVGMNITELVSAEDREWVMNAVREQHKSVYGHVLQRKDGSRFRAEARSRTIDDGTNPVRLTAVRDIDQQLKREDALRESEERFRAAFEFSGIGMALVSADGRWLSVNPRILAIVGYDRDSLLKLTFQDITHPDDLNNDLEHVRRLLNREESFYSMEKRYIHRQGHVVWVRLTVSTVRDKFDKFQYFVAQIEDVSERHASEVRLRELNEQLVEKNREIYSFAHSASHDLKEPVRTVGGYAMFLGEQPAVMADPESVGFVANIKEATGRMIELIESLLQMAEVGASTAGSDPVELSDVIDRVEHDLAGRLRETGGAIRREDHLPTLLGNRVQIRQVFQNLVANGLKFRKPGVAPVVTITTKYLPPAPGGRWLLAVALADNGIGFPADRSTKLFEPFKRFHARSDYPGTGLGLAIVRRVVERHGGSISAEGAPGQGARFTFTLPVEPPAEAMSKAA